MKLIVSYYVVGALFGIAEADECYLPIDVMFLQDTTGSFEDDLPLVVRQIPDMVAAILEQNPDSWFGVAEFKDKPYFPLGQQDSDFCYKLDGKLTSDATVFQQDYAKLYASGGGDIPEAQYQALIDIAQDPSVGWRPIVSDARSESGAGARVVIMSTDAPSHLPGDMAKWSEYPSVPQGLPANLGTISQPNINVSCTDYDYPSPQQMATALKEQSIYLTLLTPNYANMTAGWNWVIQDLLGEPAEFYQFIEENSSDLMSGVLKVLKSVTETACATTTTSSPTEVTTSTQLVTTTATTEAATTQPTTTTTEVTTTTQPTTTTTEVTTTTQPTTTTTEVTTTTQPTTTTTEVTTTTQPTTTTTEVTTTTQPTTTTEVTTTTQPTTTTTEVTTTTQPTTTTEVTTTTQPTTTSTMETTESGTESLPPHCVNPCPPHPEPCCFHPAMVIKVNNRPQKLVIDYEAPTSE